ncbi:MAG: inositol monophosphatase family protein [Stellaceae bacterium]
MAAAPMSDPSHLELAERAAREAGRLLRARDAALLEADLRTHHDIKLTADREAEALILAALAATGIPVLAEESGASGAARQDGLRWVVDPLDGTANYARGLPLCCVAIGLLRREEPVLGLIHDFNRDETFSGGRAFGAWLNGDPIEVSRVATAEEAILATGLPARRDYSAASLAEFGRSLGRWHKVRMLGSAALSLAYVAAGRADLYCEEATLIWDVAAGCAIVEGAGGIVERTARPAPGTYDVMAGNEALVRHLAGHGS